METQATSTCCPPFDPVPWDEKELQWSERKFVRDRVRSFFHIPLNFGAVMRRNMERLEAAGERSDRTLVLADENSLWGADVYISVDREIPGMPMATLSGRFLSKVFEGPYRGIRDWVEEMKRFCRQRGATIRKLYFYYTTCPTCAKKYGKNYVVLLAQV